KQRSDKMSRTSRNHHHRVNFLTVGFSIYVPVASSSRTSIERESVSVNFESNHIVDILDSTGETDRRLLRHVTCRSGLTEIVDIPSTKVLLRNLTQISTTTALTTGSTNFFNVTAVAIGKDTLTKRNDRRRSWHTAMRDDQGEAREYRCGEDGFYLYRYDGLCYDDEGFSYHFGEDSFYYDTEEGRPYDSGGFCGDENDVRLEYAEGPPPNESFNLGEHTFVPGTPCVVSARKSPLHKRVNVVDLADTEPEEIRSPWRPRASVSSRPEEGEVVEAVESVDDTISTPLVGSLSLP
ncbi:Uncharacterized protein APZ42_005832, partial [Daphnia magna]